MLEAIILKTAPELTRTVFDSLLPLVSQAKRERIKRFRFFRDAQNALLGDVLARVEICRITGLKNEELVFLENRYGKPFQTNDPDIHYNISHTGHYVACAVSSEPVGIDIELIKPFDIEIAERFFASDEAEYVLSDPEPRRFFEVWTKKESRVKWEGKGLSRPLNSFSVFDPAELDKIGYYEALRDGEAVCHVCSSAGERPAVRVIDTAELLRML